MIRLCLPMERHKGFTPGSVVDQVSGLTLVRTEIDLVRQGLVAYAKGIPTCKRSNNNFMMRNKDRFQ